MNTLKKIHNYLYGLSEIKYILIITVSAYILILSIAAVLSNTSLASDTTYSISSNILIEYLSGVIISPITETFLFQMAIIIFLRDLVGIKNIAIQIIISALAFGILHLPYGIIHAVTAFIMGLILAYSYIIYEKKGMHPYWVVVIIHSLSNLISISLMLL